MPRKIKLRWTPVAVDTLIALEEHGRPEIAQRIIDAVADHLTRQPSIYREVAIRDPGNRSRTKVRRLYLGRELPYLVYFYYDKPEGIVEVIRILHVRQRPIER